MKKVSKLLLLAGCLAFVGVVAADGSAGEAPVDSEDGTALAEGSEIPKDGTKISGGTAANTTPSSTSTSTTGAAAGTTTAATTTAPVVVAATKAKNLPVS